MHEIKYDGYRMHARIDGSKIQLLTLTGLDWSHRYRRTIDALGALRVKSAYVDGELCALAAPTLDQGADILDAPSRGARAELDRFGEATRLYAGPPDDAEPLGVATPYGPQIATARTEIPVS